MRSCVLTTGMYMTIIEEESGNQEGDKPSNEQCTRRMTKMSHIVSDQFKVERYLSHYYSTLQKQV